MKRTTHHSSYLQLARTRSRTVPYTLCDVHLPSHRVCTRHKDGFSAVWISSFVNRCLPCCLTSVMSSADNICTTANFTLIYCFVVTVWRKEVTLKCFNICPFNFMFSFKTHINVYFIPIFSNLVFRSISTVP